MKDGKLVTLSTKPSDQVKENTLFVMKKLSKVSKSEEKIPLFPFPPKNPHVINNFALEAKA